MSDADLTVTSHEVDGRVLSGVGATADDLQKVMARHSAEPTADAEAPAQEPPAAQAKPDAVESKPSRGQKRFDDLTREREDAKREADAAKQEAARLKAELDAVRQSQSAQPPQAPQQSPAAPERKAPELPGELKSYDTYLATHADASYDDYLEARFDWRQANLKAPEFDARIRQSIEADRASRSVAERQAEIGRLGRSVFPDFDAVVLPNVARLNALGIDRWAYIDQHPQAHHLIYAITRDPALSQRLASCQPFEFSAELAKIAPPTAVASSASTGGSGSVTPPQPMQPVGSGSKTTAPSSAELAAKGYDFDKSGYREKRAAERGVRRR